MDHQRAIKTARYYIKIDEFVKSKKAEKMSCLVQHLIKSSTYETLKQVQKGDKSGLFTRPSKLD